MAKKLFVFGIGGTGSRVIKSLTMLLASGMKPGDFDEVIPLLIDPHKELPEFKNCNSLVSLYSNIHNKLYSDKQEIKKGFFRTDLHSLKTAASDSGKKGETVKSDISFDEASSEVFRKFIGLSQIEDNHPTTTDFLSLLFSEKNYNQPLSVGFKGNPHMGSIALNAIIGGPAYNAFVSAFNAGDRIFIISSMFGGTGAAGFPLLLHNFRDKDAMKKQEIRGCKIGSLSVMPYFKLEDPGQSSDIDSNDFMTKTKSALTYYSREKFKELYNAIYYIADPDGQTTPYKNDEKKQDNKAHLIELLGALSIFHFAGQQSFDKGLHEYCLGDDTSKVNFTNIGDPAKEMLAENLTALQLLSKLHPATKSKAKSLPYCKTNNFNSDFFNSEFFVGNETGLDKFFETYFNPWVNELNGNQRGFSPFNLKIQDDTFYSLVNGYPKEKHALVGKVKQSIDLADLQLKMSEVTNDPAVKGIDNSNKECRYLTMCWTATNNFINSKTLIGK